MKVDNAFDKTELLQHLRTAYALPLQSITFLPEGEDSYGYIVVSETDEKYFAKASASVPDACLQLASLLQHRCNISGVVAPLKTSNGALGMPWHDFRVSLFPFIEGKSRWDLWKVEKDFTDAELGQTAVLLATIHHCTDEIKKDCLRVAKYDLPLRNELDTVLATSTIETPPQNPYQKQLLEALAAHRSSVLAAMERYDELGLSLIHI